MKYKDPEEFFKYLIDKYGLSFFNGTLRCLAIMLIKFDGDNTTTLLLKTAFKNKVYKTLIELQEPGPIYQHISIEKAIKILTDDCIIDKEKSIQTVGWLANIIYPYVWKMNYMKDKNSNENNLNNFMTEKKDLIEENQDYERKNWYLKCKVKQLTETLEKKDIIIDSLIISDKIKINDNNQIDNQNWILKPINLEMIYCPPGEFMRGTPVKEYEKYLGGQYKVVISKPFMIGKFPITQKQYQAIMWYNPSRFEYKKDENSPVDSVNWKNAKDFCEKLNSRYSYLIPQGYKFDLPTEDQWEYACRAGVETDLNNGKNITSLYGDCPNLDEVGWYRDNSECHTHPVGLKKPNAWGIYDMHGNVMEWCIDSSKPGYSSVLCGGDWHDCPWFCHPSFRFHGNSMEEYNGFRVAIVPIIDIDGETKPSKE